MLKMDLSCHFFCMSVLAGSSESVVFSSEATDNKFEVHLEVYLHRICHDDLRLAFTPLKNRKRLSDISTSVGIRLSGIVRRSLKVANSKTKFKLLHDDKDSGLHSWLHIFCQASKPEGAGERLGYFVQCAGLTPCSKRINKYINEY